MGSTSIKVSVETRDRIRALGGRTYEDTIVEALDALDASQFWAEADAARIWQNSLSDAHRERLRRRASAVDAAFVGIE